MEPGRAHCGLFRPVCLSLPQCVWVDNLCNLCVWVAVSLKWTGTHISRYPDNANVAYDCVFGTFYLTCFTVSGHWRDRPPDPSSHVVNGLCFGPHYRKWCGNDFRLKAFTGHTEAGHRRRGMDRCMQVFNDDSLPSLLGLRPPDCPSQPNSSVWNRKRRSFRSEPSVQVQ